MRARALPVAASALLACLALAPGALAVGLAERQEVDAAGKSTAPGLIAPASVCPGQTSLQAPAEVQERAMGCLTDFARQGVGLPPLAESTELGFSAGAKSGDVLRCDDFSHFACEREFTYWMDAFGYLGEGCWRAGENLAWGSGEEGTARSIFRAWMRSPTHRENILSDFTQLGVGLKVGGLEGLSGTRVWTQHFGSRCESA